MSRIISFGQAPATDRIKIDEMVYGEGPEMHDALQSLLDSMERRCMQIREELTRERDKRF